MSYTIQIWEKPADWPWPATKAEADTQYERVEAGPQVPMNPQFTAWARAVEQRFAGFWTFTSVVLTSPTRPLASVSTPAFQIGVRRLTMAGSRRPAWA